MPVAALRVEVHLRAVHSLKEKRAVIRPVLEGCRHRFSAAAAEVEHQDRWQRATVGVAVVSGSVAHTAEVLDAVERFIWSFPELEVIRCQRRWLEEDT